MPSGEDVLLALMQLATSGKGRGGGEENKRKGGEAGRKKLNRGAEARLKQTMV